MKKKRNNNYSKQDLNEEGEILLEITKDGY